jgi:hypothetical protein
MALLFGQENELGCEIQPDVIIISSNLMIIDDIEPLCARMYVI